MPVAFPPAPGFNVRVSLALSSFRRRPESRLNTRPKDT